MRVRAHARKPRHASFCLQAHVHERDDLPSKRLQQLRMLALAAGQGVELADIRARLRERRGAGRAEAAARQRSGRVGVEELSVFR